MKKKTILASSILLFTIFSMSTLVQASRIPTTTTIPPIPSQSAGVQLQCSPPQAFPGSVTPGSSGFVRIRCPDKNGFIQFGQQGVATTTLTPTFTLGTGYTNASIILFNSAANGPCNFSFRTLTVGNVTVSTGSFLTHPIVFGNPPTNSTMLLASNYDYCLQYQNAPSTGLPGFDIVWT